jgi:hypothetical protein
MGLLVGSWYMRFADDGTNRLEVRPSTSTVWGTVTLASNSSDAQSTATALCSMFGFTTATTSTTSTGSGPVYLPGLSCPGSASNLSQCTNGTAVAAEVASHVSDVALSCGRVGALDDNAALTVGNIVAIVFGTVVVVAFFYFCIRQRIANEADPEFVQEHGDCYSRLFCVSPSSERADRRPDAAPKLPAVPAARVASAPAQEMDNREVEQRIRGG